MSNARADAEHAIAVADTMGDDVLGAGSRIALAFVLTNLGPRRETLDLLDEWRARYGSLKGSWEDAASCILTAHAALFLGDASLARTACGQAQEVVEHLGDDWGRDHLESVLGALAQAEHRFGDAITHLTAAATAAATAAGRLGFPATEAYHLSHLGRVLHQAGDDKAAITTLQRSIEIGETTGDLRVAALAAVRLGRVLRGTGDRIAARAALDDADRWYQGAGGGDGALLAACLLAAMDAEDGIPEADTRLTTVTDDARSTGDIETAVLALDALAHSRARAGEPDEAFRLLHAADELMPTAEHRLSDRDRDRLDAPIARALIAASATGRSSGSLRLDDVPARADVDPAGHREAS